MAFLVKWSQLCYFWPLGLQMVTKPCSHRSEDVPNSPVLIGCSLTQGNPASPRLQDQILEEYKFVYSRAEYNLAVQVWEPFLMSQAFWKRLSHSLAPSLMAACLHSLTQSPLSTRHMPQSRTPLLTLPYNRRQYHTPP